MEGRLEAPDPLLSHSSQLFTAFLKLSLSRLHVSAHYFAEKIQYIINETNTLEIQKMIMQISVNNSVS